MNEKTSKILNYVLAAALVVSIPVGAANIGNISTENKKAEAETSTTISATEESTTAIANITTTVTSTTKNNQTTQKAVKNNMATTTTIKSETSSSSTTAKTPLESMGRGYAFNKSLSSNDKVKIFIGNGTVYIKNGESSGKLQLYTYVKNDSNKDIKIDLSKLIATDNNGRKLNISPNSPMSNYVYQNFSSDIILDIYYDTTITSINVQYTFDDGTTASTVLNLN